MRRTKEWWARLTADERSELVYIERNASQASVGWDGYLPDDCGEIRRQWVADLREFAQE